MTVSKSFTTGWCRPVALALACALSTGVLADKPEYRGRQDQRIYWLNDSEILFLAHDPADLAFVRRGEKNQFGISTSLYAWNLARSQPRKLASNMDGVLCYHEGLVIYSKNIDHKVVFFQGELGREKPVEGPQQVKATGPCAYLDRSDKEAEMHRYKRDRFELIHGRIDLPESYNGPIIYTPKLTGKSITLDGYRGWDLRTTMEHGGARFSPFKGAYLMSEQGFKGKQGKAWWLYPDGKTEPVSLPKGPWDAHGRLVTTFKATKIGIVARYPVPRDWALYLAKPNGFEPLIKGAVMNYSISPGGCKIAYFHQQFDAPKEDKVASLIPLLKVMDVCENKALL